jgi:hypothetical protein
MTKSKRGKLAQPNHSEFAIRIWSFIRVSNAEMKSLKNHAATGNFYRPPLPLLP